MKFTGTTIWRALLPWAEVVKRDPRFATTAWWHGPTTHVWLLPIREGLGEIAARCWQDPAVHNTDKVSWGVPVGNAYVESHFEEYLPQIRNMLSWVPVGNCNWRKFVAFAGPELLSLTAWDDKVVLVGDVLHVLSGAFGSGAGLTMEDGWVLAQAIKHYRNDLHRTLPLFERIRLPYYVHMYAHLGNQAAQRVARLNKLGEAPSYNELVKVKIIQDGGSDMSWIYSNDVGQVWEEAIGAMELDK